MADGQVYLHFNITNMITIWIMAAIGFAVLGLVTKALNKNSDAA